MKNRIFLFITLILMILGVWTLAKKNSLQSDVSSSPSTTIFPRNSSLTKSSSQALNLENFQEESVDSEFKKMLLSESLLLESPQASPETSEVRLKNISEKLTSLEQRYLMKTILEQKSPASLKIFSAYLLGLSSPHNFEAMDYLLSQNLTTPEGPTHSPEETLSMQEKALRRMLIESLLIGWQKNELSLSQVEKSFQQIPDETLRQYAFKRLEELKN